jgi:hypothetical protein
MQIQGNELLFKTLVGSQAYGTSTPASDEDFKGCYMQSTDDLVGFGYREQIDVTKDECYYELRRFMQLLQSANPTMLEMLFVPDECVVHKSPVWDILVKNRGSFLTRKCRDSFGGYAVAQIKRAKGLNKKMNWEDNRVERKDVLDFVYAYEEGKTYPVKEYLTAKGRIQEGCGLVGLDHFPGTYALYYNETYGYKGICGPDSNDIRLSSVPKGEKPLTTIYFNKDAYSIHCKDFLSYTEWLANRNTTRYVDVADHGQKVDGKNLMHCRRLIDTALEIGQTGTLSVRRPNREYLLSIRKGEVDLETIIAEAERDLLLLDDIYKGSPLPEECDKERVNEILLEMRHFKN